MIDVYPKCEPYVEPPNIDWKTSETPTKDIQSAILIVEVLTRLLQYATRLSKSIIYQEEGGSQQTVQMTTMQAFVRKVSWHKEVFENLRSCPSEYRNGPEDETFSELQEKLEGIGLLLKPLISKVERPQSKGSKVSRISAVPLIELLLAMHASAESWVLMCK